MSAAGRPWRGLLPRSGHRLRPLLAAIALCCAGLVPAEPDDAAPAAAAPRSIVDLQLYRQSSSAPIEGAAGRGGTATLISLNPRANAWYVLRLDGAGAAQAYHLENPQPLQQTVALGAAGSLRLSAAGRDEDCPLWPQGSPAPLEQARRSGLPYAPLCGGRLYLRNVVPGTYTRIERVTNFLRDHVWGGDQIVGFVRDKFFQDAFVEQAEVAGKPAAADAGEAAGVPPPARVAAAAEDIVPADLNLDVGAAAGGMQLGRWYAVRNAAGIFVSAIQPQAVAADILAGDRGTVGALDAVEARALDYLVAFDLAQFDLGFALGTDHPRLDWSERAQEQVRDARLPGPDGIGSAAPLARTGMVSPALSALTAAAFTGGFKREHGAFRYGDLALSRGGHHYGFIEQGTVFSTLQPGLSTLYVLDDGTVDMKTWTPADDALLPDIRHARQNGVPLLEYDAASGRTVPGRLVRQWGPGNWSGSKDEKFRTLRAAVCLRQTAGQRFLIYGYFSTATPSAIVRVFQAYGCRYAMHLDMNALEHTYLAVYTRRNGALVVQHLIQGMTEVDKKGGGQLAPRFLSFPDDRDFFYLVRRGKPS